MNTIPRLVGDEIQPVKPTGIEEKEVAIIAVKNYGSLDNNRELQRLFPRQLPAWIKYIIIATRNPGESDVRVSDIQISSASGKENVAIDGGSSGDAIPVGAIWIAIGPTVGQAASKTTHSIPNTRIWICTSNTATNAESSSSEETSSWVELATPEYIERYHAPVAYTLDANNSDLSNFEPTGGYPESYLFITNARVLLHKGKATEIDLGKRDWYLISKYCGNFAYQKAVAIDDPSVVVHRTRDSNGGWKEWAYAYAEWN